VNASWVAHSTAYWRESFDWPKFQERMNKHPNFIANLTTPAGDSMGVHFMGLFSQKADAIPVAFFHGWPGAFLEFIDLLDVIKTQFNASSSPYHIIVPSLPGFTLSSAPSPESSWGTANTSALMDDLLLGLGFKSGYIAQGGDIGSFVARTLAMTSESCKGEISCRN
jgi:pimeloyl-ACP methyl ester carboxylesterase